MATMFKLEVHLVGGTTFDMNDDAGDPFLLDEATAIVNAKLFANSSIVNGGVTPKRVYPKGSIDFISIVQV